MLPDATSLSDSLLRNETSLMSYQHHSTKPIQEDKGYAIATAVTFALVVTSNVPSLLVLKKSRLTMCARNFFYGYFLRCLCVNNLLSAIIWFSLEFLRQESQYWERGRIFCQFVSIVRDMSLTFHIVTLVVITFERQRQVVHPMKRRRTFMEIKMRVFYIWVYTIIISSPRLVLFVVLNTDNCVTTTPTHKHRKIYWIFWLWMNMILPLFSISTCLASIVYAMKRAFRLTALNLKRRAEHARFVRFSVLLTLLFLIFTLPECCLYLSVDYSSQSRMDMQLVDETFPYLHLLTWFVHVGSPILYCCSSSKELNTKFRINPFRNAFPWGRIPRLPMSMTQHDDLFTIDEELSTQLPISEIPGFQEVNNNRARLNSSQQEFNEIVIRNKYLGDDISISSRQRIRLPTFPLPSENSWERSVSEDSSSTNLPSSLPSGSTPEICVSYCNEESDIIYVDHSC